MKRKNLRYKNIVVFLFVVVFGVKAQQESIPTTVVHYFSGKGADDSVYWDFYCTEGFNSGKWTKIKVPSCWETQGFGQFQYGIEFYGEPFPEGIAKEEGLYKYEFDVPDSWKNHAICLVFDGSMTDTEVKVNGLKAGEKHQGGFYRFSYDVTDLLKYGKKNLLEVTVKKESENASVNLAERRADYWNFGGIFRPVFLEIKPVIHIDRVAIHAKADGSFYATCYLGSAASENLSVKTEILDRKDNKVAEGTLSIKKGSDWTMISLNAGYPDLWTAETPNLYSAKFTLSKENGKAVHRITEKFGFRTIEVRESDGLYINGVKVNIRGVNRHSFRPETGRTLDRSKNYEDVRLIKEMNMNAVRLSHYPPDPDFLEACDELGLYVMNELGGWHGKYDTPTGKKLVKEMVTRDVNHPSIIWWSNGNEKGWNIALDEEFHRWDLQKRPVLHPQGNFGGFETMHYRSYGETQAYMRLPQIFMPTEFLHGLYDGGLGAGLYDYWEIMRTHPRCAGGFLWVFADEGVKRVDLDGRIDTRGNYGADGIVGPHHEREGSFYTIKEIWSPVQIMNDKIDRDFDGDFIVENRYDFLSLNTCFFTWEQVSFPSSLNSDGKKKILKKGEVKGSDIAPHKKGIFHIDMPPFSDDVNGLFLTAKDVYGHELWRWSWKIDKKNVYKKNNDEKKAVVNKIAPTYKEDLDHIKVKVGDKSYFYDKKDGFLKHVTVNNRKISFGNGPRFVAARRADRSLDQFFNHDDPDAKKLDRTYKEFVDLAVVDSIFIQENENRLTVNVVYKLGNMQRSTWTVHPDGLLELTYVYRFDAVVDLMGIRFDYPEDKVIGKRWLGDGPYRVWQNRIHGVTYDVWENEYNDPVPGETFIYPEFKGYFSNCSWMNIETQEGLISIVNETPNTYIGIYQPRDGRDGLLYTLPESGISVMDVIPPVRNKVNATDLIGPSSQPHWVKGEKRGKLIFRFQ